MIIINHFSILNYQGSKKNLLDFIHSNLNGCLEENNTILDIFSGSCSVGYSFKDNHTIYANDSEYYAFVISKALLSNYSNIDHKELLNKILKSFDSNIGRQQDIYLSNEKLEQHLLSQNDSDSLINLYINTPTIWNNTNIVKDSHDCFELFMTYYSTSYFGIKQAMEIDALRYSFEIYKNEDVFYALLSSLFYAMKECVFSKDGHMAQPLNLTGNKLKLIKQRKKSILELFQYKLNEFFSSNFVPTSHCNKVYNLNFEELLQNEEIREEVDVIYADPPYTDMQYSRYYHLLNIVGKYEYLKPTLIAKKVTKGLYLEGRYQSKLSSRTTCFSHFKELINFSKKYNKSLIISFAYPKDCKTQKTDRYVMSVDEIVAYCQLIFGRDSVSIVTKDYLHSNHRNSESKKVLEYLIICKK